MNTKWFSVLLSLLVISTLLIGNPIVSAQEIIDPEFISKENYLPNYVPKITNSLDSTKETTIIGEPGTVYSYERTFGETEVAYLSDILHINYPWGIGTDGENLWIGEHWGNRALKYSNNGNFEMQIGISGNPDFETVLMGIKDIEIDNSGNIWVVDGGASHIVKFSPSGEILMELGYIFDGGDDNDRFLNPQSITFDSSGNIYVSDGAPWYDSSIGNHRIQIFDKDGNYLTTIGETSVCGLENDQLCGPRHIAIYEDLLFVTDSNNHRVQVFDISSPTTPSYVNTLGTTGEIGDDNSHFNYPSGVEVDVNYIYIADLWNNRVQIYNRNSLAYETTIGGVWGTGNYQFKGVSDVAVDANGFLYISDFVNTRVQQFDEIEGSWIFQRTYGVTGEPYITDGYHYNHPSSVAIATDGSIFLTEEFGHRLVKFNSKGELQWTIGAAGVKGDWDYSNYRFNQPLDVDLDSSGKIYVADQYHARVQVYNPDGSYFATISEQLWCPVGLTIDVNDYVYVADWCQNTVLIYNSNYELIKKLGESGVSGFDIFHFNNPRDVAIASSGKIYVSDSNNFRVQIFNSNYSYINTIGENGVSGNDFSHFGGIDGLFIDKYDNLYVVDGGNDRLQVFDPSGAYLTTIGGSWGNNTGQIQAPGKLSVDLDGNIYIADWGNHRIQKYSPGYPNWEQVNINGFGDRRNEQIPSMVVFKNYLYVGTWLYDGERENSQIWRSTDSKNWEKVASDFGNGVSHMTEFNDKLFAGTWDGNLFYSENGESWTPIPDISLETGIARFEVYNDSLFLSSWNHDTGTQIWQTKNGLSWTKMTVEFERLNNIGAISSEVFNNYLYYGVNNSVEGAELWRFNGSAWTKVFDHGLDNSNNIAISALAEFNEILYAAVWAETGVQVLRSSNGLDWELSVDSGLDTPNNLGRCALEVIGNDLFLVISNEVTGLEVWKTNDGKNWVQIAESGFGDSNNVRSYWDSATVNFNNKLVVGVTNWANGVEVWSYDTQKYIFLPLLMR